MWNQVSVQQQTLSLIRGDSSDVFRIKVNDVEELTEDWQCRMVIAQELENPDFIFLDKMLEKSEDNLYFVGLIEPEESEILSCKVQYFIIFEISNLNMKFRRELQYKLKVMPQGAL